MAMIHTLSLPNSSGTIQNHVITVPYTTCSTAAGTQAKTAAFSNFALATGVAIRVKFTADNTNTAPTLNVNSTGAKSIKYNGAAFADLCANVVYDFVYDGTDWIVLDPPLVWHTF